MRLARCIVIEINLARIGKRFANANGASNYADFIEAVRSGYLESHFSHKYPALWHREWARVEDYLGNLVLMADRLELDSDLLRESSLAIYDAEISEVHVAGDSHHGLATCILTMRSGDRLVYRPRSAGPDTLFKAILDVVNDARAPLPSADVVDRSTYHWQEFVSESPSSELAAPVVRQLGSLLAISYAIGLSDLHHENVLLTERGPVVVDPECGPAPPEPVGWFPDLPTDHLGGVAILPFHVRVDEKGIGANWGVIGYQEQFAMPYEVHAPVNDGTDRLYLSREAPRRATVETNFSTGRWHPSLTTEFLSGFESTGRALLDARETILALLEHAEASARLVLRPTQFYADLLRLTSFPNFAVSDDRTRDFIGSRLTAEHGPEFTTIIEVELRELSRGSIPRFEAPIAGCIEVQDSELETRSGLAGVAERIESFATKSERTRMRRACVRRLMTEFGNQALPIGGQTARFTSADQVVRHAIGQLVEDVTHHGDQPLWESLVLSDVGGYRVQSSVLDLYGGATGTALALLSGLHAFDIRDGRASALISQVSDAVISTVETDGQLPVGLFNGVAGAALFAASMMSLEPDEPRYRQILETSLHRAARDLDASVGTDIVSGAAGVLALASNLRRAGFTDTAAILALRNRSIQILESAAKEQEGYGATWPDQHGEWLGGFSHGVAGIAWALARSESDIGLALARRAWQAQRALFDAETGMWKDLRTGQNAPEGDFHAWCHGADGILISAIDSGLNLPRTEKDMILGWARTPPPDSATLCHGRAGRLATLAWIRSRHSANVDTLSDQLHSYRQAVLEDLGMRSYADDAFSLNSGLLLGRAGALYALAFAERPASVPFVLLSSVPS
ncbi:type 2 lanthipeptide synthetase LanM family protein [Microbacterium sp. MTN4-26]